jgi:uncharacterized protein (DUF2126 family)
VYLPGAGWIGLDPTSGLFAGEGHIPLACTPHPVSAAPITGGIDESETKFEHRMSVKRVAESPRVTKPYSDEQWQAVDAFGRRIERQLATDDVRVTIGGEPTFVAMDDPDAPEWNTAATGPTKRKYAADLIDRCAPLRPAGLLWAGKWYPGSSCRKAFSLYWRRDERPMGDPALVAAGKTAATAAQARDFLTGVATRLELDPVAILPAYEDPWHFIGQERKIPENLDPATNRLDDAMARTRLARVFERGLGKPVGYVLPVQRWNAKAHDARRWSTEPWSTRSGKLLLVPGDSPLGFRLPLPSLPMPPLQSVRHPRIPSPRSASCRCRIRRSHSFQRAARPAATPTTQRPRRGPHAHGARSRARTGASACSCRPWPSSRITSSSSRRSKTRARSSACRFTSKVTSRRATRA